MRRVGRRGRVFAVAAAAIGCAGPAGAGDPWWQQGRDLLEGRVGGPALPTGEIAAGLREALRVGTERVVARLGRPGGFQDDPRIHIPLPDSLASVQAALGRIGWSASLDALEAKLNEAAEVATPKARDLFLQAIAQMTLDDVRQIYDGPDDAATRYFQRRMSAPLAREMAPVVEASLSEVGAIRKYDEVMGRYRSLPFVPDARADLGAYVVEKGMDGIFHYLARQEAAIRNDPAARTTQLLRQVFGARSASR
jgi:hypothetical protein